MKIVHVIPSAPYNDYWGYQDNLLPKFQKRLGHEITVLTTNLKQQEGKIVETECSDYFLNDGERVVRLAKKKYCSKILTALCSKLNVWIYLKDIKPDIVFVHGLVSTTIYDVIKYKKKINPKCIIVQDNHLDYYNFPVKDNIKGRIIRWFYCRICRKSLPYVNKVYGVTPWRKIFAEEYFKVPDAKTDVLLMGGDDDKIHFNQADEIRKNIRDKLKLGDDDFVLITGGKIDKTKNIHLLMQAVRELNEDNLKLIVFGQPDNKMASTIDELSKDSHIRYIGWLDSSDVYNYFLASDLVVFPGTHSVMWEQAVACGIPLIVKDWEGMHHVDVGGNCLFLQKDDIEEIKEKINNVYHDVELYKSMLKVAKEKGISIFSYKEIAKRSIEENE